ncbi:MAG: cupin domain-containing protein [Deltaproteobacteria bacterium]|nr:cupin domain-containing protein [Deltaproteobacteria bacterium]
MQTSNWQDCEDVKIEKFPYRGKMRDVIGTSVRWLSKFGDDGNGLPEYGLRLFTIQEGGQIPLHNHFYIQTMHIVSGQFECWQFDPESDELKDKKICDPGTSIYIPSMEPHGMKNLSPGPSTFLCCICNVYDDQEML